jgi:hypothetical protein
MFRIFKVLKVFLVLILPLIMQGCLHFNTASYKIELKDSNSGSVTVFVKDIKSDAIDKTELNEDQKNLFDFALKSEKFIEQMESEGKFITDRKLILNGENLDAQINYNFKNINDVEGIVFEDPFYYLTLQPGDSVVSTNGKIIESKDYKRIIWDSSIDTLEFEMFSDDTSGDNLTSMAAYYNKE